jgi:hypothetical protein
MNMDFCTYTDNYTMSLSVSVSFFVSIFSGSSCVNRVLLISTDNFQDKDMDTDMDMNMDHLNEQHTK